jgi:hypothetical protein
LGKHGPFFFNQNGWEVFFEPYRLEDEDDESDSGSEK